MTIFYFFFFSSRRRHTRLQGDWSSDVCSSDLIPRSLRGPDPSPHPLSRDRRTDLWTRNGRRTGAARLSDQSGNPLSPSARLEKKGYLRSVEKRKGQPIRKFYRARPLARKALGAMRAKVTELLGELNETR